MNRRNVKWFHKTDCDQLERSDGLFERTRLSRPGSDNREGRKIPSGLVFGPRGPALSNGAGLKYIMDGVPGLSARRGQSG